MIRINFVFEDTALAAVWEVREDESTEAEAEPAKAEPKWYGTVTDIPTQKRQTFAWTALEMAAVLTLIQVDEGEMFDIPKLYEIAEPLIKGWPVECRPFP